MKKILKIFIYVVLAFLLVIAGVLIYVKTALPDVGPASDLKIEYTPARIARGEYLANAVNVCMDCHSKRDWTKFSAPLVPGTLGMGGERFDQNVGMPGIY